MTIRLIFLSLTLLLSSCSGGNSSFVVQTKLDNVAIYYGYLNSLNSATLGWNNDNVVTFMSQYDIFVVGDTIQENTHADYANSTYIIPKVVANGTKVFGYISIGNTLSHSMADLKTDVDQWVTLGATGIFVDEFGFDYAPGTDLQMRQRQNEIVNYIHTKNLNIVANAWDPDDIFVKESSVPTTVTQGDYYLLESYGISSVAQLSLSAYREKVEKVIAAKKSHSIKALGVSTTLALSSAFQQSDFDYMTVLAQLDGLDGIGWGTLNFSAAGSDHAVMPFRSISSSLNNLILLGESEVNTTTQKISRRVGDGSTIEIDYPNFSYQKE